LKPKTGSEPFNRIEELHKWEPGSIVRHPPATPEGVKIGDVLPPVRRKLMRDVASPDGLRKVGRVPCETCRPPQKRCTCAPLTAHEVSHC